MMTGITITQAALYAALRRVRKDSNYDGLDTLLTLLDPAHAPPAEIAAADVQIDWNSALTVASARCQASEAGRPAPPTIDLPAGPAEGVAPRRDTPAADGAPAPEAPPPAQAAEGRPPATSIPGKWTRDRIALLAEHLPTCVDRPALLARVNALPGLPIASVRAMMVKARDLNIQVEPWVRRAIETAAGQRGGRVSVEMGLATPPSEVRTAERFAAFRTLWMDPALSVPDIHARMNAMPGVPIKNSTLLYGWAKKAGLPTQRPLPPDDIEDEAGAERSPLLERTESVGGMQGQLVHLTISLREAHAAPPPAPQDKPAAPPPRTLSPRNSRAGPALAGEASAKADAFESFSAGQTARQVTDDFGIGLNTISTWHAEWLRQQKGSTS
jgi:hypothetical protein